MLTNSEDGADVAICRFCLLNDSISYDSTRFCARKIYRVFSFQPKGHWRSMACVWGACRRSCDHAHSPFEYIYAVINVLFEMSSDACIVLGVLSHSTGHSLADETSVMFLNE